VQAPMVSIAAESALRTRLADGASVIIADIPASWQEARAETRSHDSHRYGTRFMLRLDEPSQTKLQQLVNRFGVSQAPVIRQLIVLATPEAFPQCWHTRAAERSGQPSGHQGASGRQPDVPSKPHILITSAPTRGSKTKAIDPTPAGQEQEEDR
jgi:hypothetical protein